MDKPRSSAPIIAAVLLLLPVLYVGSYLALEVPGLPNPFVPPYRFGDEYAWRLYWPLEQIDRRLRPGAWNPVIGLPAAPLPRSYRNPSVKP